MKIFLRLKHWQVFLLTIGLWVLAELMAVLWIIGDFSSTSKPVFIYYPIWALANTFFFLWLGGVSLYLYQKHLNKEMQEQFSFSLLIILLSIAYLGTSLFIGYWTWFSQTLQTNTSPINSSSLPIYVLGVAVLVFFLSLFFALNLFSKLLVMAERKSLIRSFDYFNEYVMVVVFPIGIWILQPRINRLLTSKSKS